MSDSISGAFDFFGGAISGAANAVGSAASSVGGAVADVATGAVDAAGSLFTGAADALGLGSSAASDLGGAAATDVGAAASALPTATAPLSDAAASAITAEPLPALSPGAAIGIGGPVSANAAQALDQTVIEDVTGAGAAGPSAGPGLASLQGPAGLEGPITAPLTPDSGTFPGQVAATASATDAAPSGLTADALLKAPAGGGGGVDISRVGESAGGAGIGKSISDVLSSPALRLGAAALPLASTLLRGQPQLPPQINTLQNKVTAPLVATENAQLKAANAGQITPGDAAMISTYVTDQTNQLFQQLANEGVQNPQQDSRFIQGMQQIKQQAMVMTQNFINQEFSTAFQAAGTASSNLIAAAKAQVQQDSNFTNALSAAMTSFGLLATLGAGGSALAKAA